MRCNKSRTSYMLMVLYRVVPYEGEADDYSVWTPCMRDLGWEGGVMTQEYASYLNEEEAVTAMTDWQQRFPGAQYTVHKVISR